MSIGTVTIIIPTYKRPLKLRRAIESVLAQTYTDLKVVVYDNASGDATSAIVQDLAQQDPRIDYFCHATNLGFVENFNFGLRRIATPFFGVLTDDDYFLPSFLEDAMRAFQRYPHIQLSILSAPFVEEDGTVIFNQLDAWPKEGLYESGESIRIAARGFHPILTMCVFRLALREELHFSKRFDSMCDIPVLLSALAQYPFYLSKTVGGYFFKHENSLGNQFAKIENSQALCAAFLHVESQLTDNSKISAGTRTSIVAEFQRRVDKVLFFLLLNNLTAANAVTIKYLRSIVIRRSLSFWQIAGSLLCMTSYLLSANMLARALRFTRTTLRNLRRTKKWASGANRF